MKQSAWKAHLEEIEAEVLRRGRPARAPTVLQRFGNGLSTTMSHFFAEPHSFTPAAPLSVEQRAFMHSLQLYDIRAVMRLVANYDASKGLKAVLPGIEKSFQSLAVIPKLKQLTENTREDNALNAYRRRLEEALKQVLKCTRKELYDEDVLAEKMVAVSEIPESLHDSFFAERLRALFSVNYRTYLMLKNRHFLKRLKHSAKNPKIHKWQQRRLVELVSHFEKEDECADEQLTENLDFRVLELLVKEQIQKFGEQKNTTELAEETNRKPQTPNSGFESFRLNQSGDSLTAYEQLCALYAKPIEALSGSFKPVPECSSPYFRARTEEYTGECATFFRQLFGGHPEVSAANRNFALELLKQRGQEYHAAERWGVVSKKEGDMESAYLRPAPGVAPVMDRKIEWSLLIGARLPFKVRFPLEKGRIINLEKGRRCIFQIGTAFFDQERLDERNEHPDVFFKLLFGGHILTRRTAVIYAGQKPFFTTTLEQMWRCRGLSFLFLPAASRRFALELSPSLQDFLVQAVPQSINVHGAISVTEALPDFLKSDDED